MIELNESLEELIASTPVLLLQFGDDFCWPCQATVAKGTRQRNSQIYRYERQSGCLFPDGHLLHSNSDCIHEWNLDGTQNTATSA